MLVGVNALVAAAMLGKKGRTALVLDRNAAIGGRLCTEIINAPSFVHDVMATTLVLFRTSPAYQALSKDFEARGFAFADTNLPIGVLRPGGSSVTFSMDYARNIRTFEALAEGDGHAAAEMDGLGPDAPFLFSLLGGSLWSWGTGIIVRRAWRLGSRGLMGWFGEALAPARGHLEATYRSDAVRALWTPWVLHTGLGPESAYSAATVKVIAFAIEAAGCPIAARGAKSLLYYPLKAPPRRQCDPDLARVALLPDQRTGRARRARPHSGGASASRPPSIRAGPRRAPRSSGCDCRRRPLREGLRGGQDRAPADQFFLWRPLKASMNHSTLAPNIYHIGDSTHPSPGLGVSGFILASSL